MLPFILLKETARDVHAGPELLNDADGVYLGIEERYMTPEVWSTLHTFSKQNDSNFLTLLTGYWESDRGFGWDVAGVPVNVQIIKRHYNFFKRPDIKFFRLMDYRIPNPFANYWKARYIIK